MQLAGLGRSETRRLDSHQEDLADTIAAGVASWLREQPWMIELARSGWVAKAIVYMSLAWGAAVIAVRRPWLGDAEYTSIVHSLADAPSTRILLGFIAIGLVLYIAFRVLSVALIDGNDLNCWAHRGAYLLSAGSYTLIAWSAAFSAFAGPQPEGEGFVERFSRSLLSSTGGRFLVGLGGLIGLASAAYFVYKGVNRRFLSEVVTDDMSRRRFRAVVWTGTIGWVGRAAILGAASLFVTWAALDADPTQARGLDSSLQHLARDTYGAPVVMLIAIFLFVYAVYCLLTASKRQLTWSMRHSAGEKTAAEHRPDFSS